MIKNANINGEWVTVELSEDEKEKTLENLIIENIGELKRCIKHSHTAFIASGGYMSRDKVIKMLFEKQTTASYTALSQALDEKIIRMRKNEEPENENIKKIVENELKINKTEITPSEIDKCFQGHEK